MPWIFTPISVPANTPVSSPVQVTMDLMTGQVRAVAVYMPGTTNNHEAGARINAPKAQVFPTPVSGSDVWIYSYTSFYNEVFETHLDLEEVSPVRVIAEAFNTDSSAIKVQVGVYVVPFHTEEEIALRRILANIEAMRRVSNMPDVEKQIKRIASILIGGEE